MAVDRGLQPDLADALEGADEDGVDGDQAAGVGCFEVALAELRRRALQPADLLARELEPALGGGLLPELRREPLEQANRLTARREPALGGGLLQAQQPLVLGQQPVAHPDHFPRGG